MPKTAVTHIFDMPAAALWDLLGDFGDMGKWSGRPPEDCVQQGDGIGCLRTLNLGDGRKVVDRLEAQGELFYTYSIVTSPLPFKSYRATMSVAPIDDTCSTLTWTSTFEPEGMDDAKSIAFTENMYRMGIGMMIDTIAKKNA